MREAFAQRNYTDLAELTLLPVMAFFIATLQIAAIYLGALWFLIVVIRGIKRGFLRPPVWAWPFPLLFLCYVAGLFFTENLPFGFDDIETRSAFLLFPLIAFASPRKLTIPITAISWAFVAGLLVFEIYCYVEAYSCFETQRNRFCFENSAISGGIHPTYLALYLIMGIVMIVNDTISHRRAWWVFVITIAISFNLIHFVYKLYSSGPWISFAGMTVILALAFFIARRKLKMFLLLFSILVTICIFSIRNLELLNSDYTAIKGELGTYFESPSEYVELHKTDSASIRSRLVAWSVSIDFVSDHPMGVGTGDVKDELLKVYESRGMEAHSRLKLNPHNQYLQTSATVGILPGIFLLCSFGFYIWFGYRRRNYNLIALASLFMIGCFFESLFERQWGVLFFMFFLVIFLMHSENGKKQLSK